MVWEGEGRETFPHPDYLPVEVGLLIKEKDLSIQFTDAVQTIESTFADSEVAEYLGIHSGSPVLFVQRTMFGQKHKPIEFYQSFFRGDVYKFVVRFTNVKNTKGSK